MVKAFKVYRDDTTGEVYIICRAKFHADKIKKQLDKISEKKTKEGKKRRGKSINSSEVS